jgi:NAD(P)-dependent dehydrogenase (short-subunit alcohol dehydrogenase family)
MTRAAYPLSGLAGRVALVSGAAGGLGAATACALHERRVAVVLADADGAAVSGVAAAIGGRAAAMEADPTDRAAMDTVVAATLRRFGGLDVVVVCVGDAGPPAAVLDATVRAGLESVIANSGQIVLAASVPASSGLVSLAPYTRARAALEPYRRTLHRALAVHGVAVTAGYVEVGGRMAIDEAAAALAGAIERRARRVDIPRRYALLDLPARIAVRWVGRRQATTGSPRCTSRS